MQFLKKHHVWMLAVALFLFALMLRGARVQLGLPYLHHWDEVHISGEALDMLKTGDFKPGSYNYGSLLKYLNLVVDAFHYLYLMGQPDSADTFLTQLNDIKTQTDTNWHWTASHPSFYACNRMVTAVFGAGTVILLFLMARMIFRNTWMAVVPALFLASLQYHIHHSAFVTPDVPAGFFVIGSVFFSLVFLRNGTTSWFVWSLIFAGFAAATKNNSVIVVLAPVISLAWRRLAGAEAMKAKHIILLLTVPALAFFLTMPYALLDLSGFLADAGYELRHYKVMGHDGFTSQPGLVHMKFQQEMFQLHLGLSALLLAVAGICGTVMLPELAFVLILPLISFLYMGNMKVNFDRNFLHIYPFLALLMLSSLSMIHDLPKLLPKRIAKWPRRVVPILVWGLTAIYLTNMVWESVVSARAAVRDEETRTRAIHTINSMPGVAVAVFPNELRFHEEDLRQLKVPRVAEPLASIIGRPMNAPATVYVLPAHLNTSKPYAARPFQIQLARSYAKFQETIREDDVIARVGESNTNLDIFSVNPGIILYQPSENIMEGYSLESRSADSRPLSTDPIVFDNQLWQAAMKVRESVRFPVMNLSKGQHTMTFDWKYSKDLDRSVKLKLELWDTTASVMTVKRVLNPHPGGFNWGDKLERFELTVVVRRPTPIAIFLTALIDAGTDPARSGGKIYVKNLELKRR